MFLKENPDIWSWVPLMRVSRQNLLFVIVGVSITVIFLTKKNVHHYEHIPAATSQTDCCRNVVVTTGNVQSLCSDQATNRGENQRVLSYSIYGDFDDEYMYTHYYNEFEGRIKESLRFYPGWIVRLYHNAGPSEKHVHEWLCSLQCKYSHLDVCTMKGLEIPHRDLFVIESLRNKKHLRYGKTSQIIADMILGLEDQFQMYRENTNNSLLSYMQNKNIRISSEKLVPGRDLLNFTVGRTWRFLVMADPTVSVFLIRDVDSAILQREVDAVHQWLTDSNATVHAMRDHPSHRTPILAGMWGASRDRNSTKLKSVFYQMLTWKPQSLSYFDQMLLRRELWPAVSNDIMIHDSYFCREIAFKAQEWPIPFPTRRNGKYFIGWGPSRGIEELDGLTPCPEACRPSNHKNWTYC